MKIEAKKMKKRIKEGMRRRRRCWIENVVGNKERYEMKGMEEEPKNLKYEEL